MCNNYQSIQEFANYFVIASTYDIMHCKVTICTATRLMWGDKESKVIHDRTLNSLDTTERKIVIKSPDTYTHNTVHVC